MFDHGDGGNRLLHHTVIDFLLRRAQRRHEKLHFHLKVFNVSSFIIEFRFDSSIYMVYLICSLLLVHPRLVNQHEVLLLLHLFEAFETGGVDHFWLPLGSFSLQKRIALFRLRLLNVKNLFQIIKLPFHRLVIKLRNNIAILSDEVLSWN